MRYLPLILLALGCAKPAATNPVAPTAPPSAPPSKLTTAETRPTNSPKVVKKSTPVEKWTQAIAGESAKLYSENDLAWKKEYAGREFEFEYQHQQTRDGVTYGGACGPTYLEMSEEDTAKLKSGSTYTVRGTLIDYTPTSNGHTFRGRLIR